jgi:hypothetical protein
VVDPSPSCRGTVRRTRQGGRESAPDHALSPLFAPCHPWLTGCRRVGVRRGHVHEDAEQRRKRLRVNSEIEQRGVQREMAGAVNAALLEYGPGLLVCVSLSLSHVSAVAGGQPRCVLASGLWFASQ